MTMFSPEFHIWAVAQPDVAERSMTVITWTAQHGIFAIDFFREKHAVAVERKKRILALEEFLEVKSVPMPIVGPW